MSFVKFYVFFTNIELRFNKPLVKVDNDMCFEAYGNIVRFVPYTHFCALYLNTCDAIGAIMGIDTNSDPKRPYWYIYGFATYLFENCKPIKKPHLGTKVVPYLDWIYSIIEMEQN